MKPAPLPKPEIQKIPIRFCGQKKVITVQVVRIPKKEKAA